jgi:hypothetical protein
LTKTTDNYGTELIATIKSLWYRLTASKVISKLNGKAIFLKSGIDNGH